MQMSYADALAHLYRAPEYFFLLPINTHDRCQSALGYSNCSKIALCEKEGAKHCAADINKPHINQRPFHFRTCYPCI